MTSFAPLAFQIAVLVIVVAGVVMLSGVFRARLERQPPACAACGHAVEASALSRGARCPECGSDLAAIDGIRWFRPRRSPASALVAVAFIAVAFAAGPLVSYFRNPTAIAGASTAELVAKVAGGRGDAWLAVRALAQRARAGSLTPQELAAAGRAFVPVPGPDGFARQPAGYVDDDATTILLTAWQSKAISDAELALAVDSMLGERSLRIAPTVRRNTWWDPQLGFDTGSGGIRRTEALTGVMVGERRLPMRTYARASAETLRGGGGEGGQVLLDLPPGRAVLSLAVERSYVFPGNGSPTLTLAVPMERTVTVVAEDAPSWVRLLDLPNRAGDVEAAIVAGAASLDRDPRDGRCVLRVDMRMTAPQGVPLSFLVQARVGDELVGLGTHLATTPGGRGGSTESYSAHVARIDCPPATPAEVELVLTPAPAACETNPDMQEIWGREVRRRVPLLPAARTPP